MLGILAVGLPTDVGVGSVERVRILRQAPHGTVFRQVVRTGASVPADSQLHRGGVLRPLRREFVVHDQYGDAVEIRRDKVRDVGSDGETKDAVITVLAVERNVPVDELDLAVARSCGFRTAAGLREAWYARHPRSPLCHVVTFAVGDVRDRPRFLTSTRSMRWGPGKKGGSPLGDYCGTQRQASDDAEALSDAEMGALVGWNRQKDEAARARASAALAAESPSQRLLRIERYIEDLAATAGEEAARLARATVRQELRIVRQRLDQAERRKPLPPAT